jgi:hypothetical protein
VLEADRFVADLDERATLAREVRPEPLALHAQALLLLRQGQDVDARPHEKCREDDAPFLEQSVSRLGQVIRKRPAAAHQTALDMNHWLRGPRRGADLAGLYSAEGSAIAAFAFAITASARFIAALSSSLCHQPIGRRRTIDHWLLARARPALEAPQWLRLAAWHLLRRG